MEVFFWDPGEAYVESRGTKDICTTRNKQWIISFSYVKTLTSLAISSGGRFNNQTGPILVHIYPLFNNNLHVKYKSNLIRTF